MMNGPAGVRSSTSLLSPAPITHVPFVLPPICFFATLSQLVLSGPAYKMGILVGIYRNITSTSENILGT